MTWSDSRRTPIEMLAEDFSRRLQAGDHPTIDEYLVNYPSYAEGIRSLFPIIAILEEAKPQDDSHPTVIVDEPALPAQTVFGDFVIQREVGRGGMGIVYEAMQSSLNRRVALKVLPANYLPSPKHVLRFKREALSSAKLHHTNIAPVFGVGDKDGSHYYAMQLIDGYSLDSIIGCLKRLTEEEGDDAAALDEYLDSRPDATLSSTGIAQRLVSSKVTTEQPHLEGRNPTDQHSLKGSSANDQGEMSGGDSSTRFWRFFIQPTGVRTESYYWRNIAGMGIQVGGALQHAHDMAIYHRDIKPSNLMIDFTGKVWVTDFGLARVLGDTNLTESHDTVGTLRYMAPEQFRGEFDVRTEIYNLGVTLYEIATLQPAVTEPEAPRLIQQAMTEPPIRPRAINREIPRDLETIILKSIAADPADRYQSALEFTEDLRRFAAGDVIHAGRKRPLAVLWRWCQRNSTIARLASAVLILLLSVAVVATVGYVSRSKTVADAEKQHTRDQQRIKNLEDALKQHGLQVPR